MIVPSKERAISRSSSGVFFWPQLLSFLATYAAKSSAHYSIATKVAHLPQLYSEFLSFHCILLNLLVLEFLNLSIDQVLLRLFLYKLYVRCWIHLDLLVIDSGDGLKLLYWEQSLFHLGWSKYWYVLPLNLNCWAVRNWVRNHNPISKICFKIDKRNGE